MIACLPTLSTAARRSPYGERGLKSQLDVETKKSLQSLSLRRAWIEINSSGGKRSYDCVALLTESVD